eukprot:188048-Chlamydomonas_euryale.AAC.1
MCGRDEACVMRASHRSHSEALDPLLPMLGILDPRDPDPSDRDPRDPDPRGPDAALRPKRVPSLYKYRSVNPHIHPQIHPPPHTWMSASVARSTFAVASSSARTLASYR